jgi:rod shape-determining protein MreB
MGFFSFLVKEIAVDLGTANTLIIYNDRVVIDEPSIVAISRETGKLIAVGTHALMMYGKAPDNIKVIRPLKDGVIADFQAAELMLIEFLSQMNAKQKSIFPPTLKMVVCIPSGITEVEERAVRDSSEQAGAKEVRLIYEPMAAAIGIGLDVLAPSGNMVVDIGGGTSEIAVIALGGIVSNKSVKTAGDEFNADIEDYMRREHNMSIGERTAEQIKINVGAALVDIDNPPPPFEVRGRDLLTGIPRAVSISHREIAVALDASITQVEVAILNALEHTLPELSADIYTAGIYLAGGGALLRGLDKRIHLKTKLPVHVAEDPLKAVARGTAIALKNFDKFPFLKK